MLEELLHGGQALWVGSIEQPITCGAFMPGGNARKATTRSCNCKTGRPL